MNLTTVRTHQYAVWVTIGFFEVTRQGDLGMLTYNPQSAFDILGPEIGAANGRNVRYRSFYLVEPAAVNQLQSGSAGQFPPGNHLQESDSVRFAPGHWSLVLGHWSLVIGAGVSARRGGDKNHRQSSMQSVSRAPSFPPGEREARDTLSFDP